MRALAPGLQEVGLGLSLVKKSAGPKERGRRETLLVGPHGNPGIQENVGRGKRKRNEKKVRGFARRRENAFYGVQRNSQVTGD